jgi:uncharacterized protein (TIGR02145 family)
MAIDIKELFVTDLDPTGNYWWSKDKVDKINYNFIQLSNGGMIGPQGSIGVDGITGVKGSQGNNGEIGNQGAQGPQGKIDINEWEYFPESNGLPGYLFPRKNPPNTIQSSTVSLKIGEREQEVLDSEDTDPAQIVTTNPIPDAPSVNLRVEHNGSPYGYNFEFLNQIILNEQQEPISIASNLRIFPGMSGDDLNVIFTAQKILINTSSINTQNIISIDSSLIKIGNISDVNSSIFNLGKENDVNGYAKSKSVLEYKPDSTNDITNDILLSANEDGDLIWRPTGYVFGLFPIGSIISIREEEFNEDNFYLDGSIDVIEGSPLNNIYGRGKVGTDFEGWYLCNGETWMSKPAQRLTKTYLTPNLNNFYYTTAGDKITQVEVFSPFNDRIVIGAYDLSMNANPDKDGKYRILDDTSYADNDTTLSTFSIDTSQDAVNLCESKMIHIVYLEDSTLTWQNNVVAPIPPTTPTIITSPVTNIVFGDTNTAASGGNIVTDGRSPITKKGIVWSGVKDPTISLVDTMTDNGSGDAPFTSQLTGLSQGKKYYVRAYAINKEGISYGENQSFTVPLSTVKIGTQDWTKKNLDIDSYTDGTSIPEYIGPTVPSSQTDPWNNLKTGAWCYPQNYSENGPIFGKLYNWYAIMGIWQEEVNSLIPTSAELAARKQFAPDGYHVPVNAEWKTLRKFLNGGIEQDDGANLIQVVEAGYKAGNQLKSTMNIKDCGFGRDTPIWNDSAQIATDRFGFGAVPAGMRTGGIVSIDVDKRFYFSPEFNRTQNCYKQSGYAANWMSADAGQGFQQQPGKGYIYSPYINGGRDILYIATQAISAGLSVRLIKD